MGYGMITYTVWTSNNPDEWTHKFLETDDKEIAKSKATELCESKRFRFVAIDQWDKTIWSNDPATPAEVD